MKKKIERPQISQIGNERGVTTALAGVAQWIERQPAN